MENLSVRKIRSLCVFCGSSPGKDKEFVNAASDLGKRLAERKIHLVYGGGSLGLMGCVSTAAHLGGSQVLGVVPTPLTVGNIIGTTVGEELRVSSMHERIARMIGNADAFICLPGGFGTLEELFQVTSWAQLNIHQKPIGLLNINHFFDDLLSFLDKAVEQHFISQSTREILVTASTPDQLIDNLERFIYKPDPVIAQINWFGEETKKRKLDLTLRL